MFFLDLGILAKIAFGFPLLTNLEALGQARGWRRGPGQPGPLEKDLNGGLFGVPPSLCPRPRATH